MQLCSYFVSCQKNENCKGFVSALNISEISILRNIKTGIARFENLSEAQVDNLIEIDPQWI